MCQHKLNTRSWQPNIPIHQQRDSRYNIIFVFVVILDRFLTVIFFGVAMIETDPSMSISILQEQILVKNLL